MQFRIYSQDIISGEIQQDDINYEIYKGWYFVQ